MSGVAYIRFFGDDWLSGTNELTLEERGALITLVALTATTGGAVVYDMDRLGRRFGCTKGKAKKVITALAELGKIQIIEGLIENRRALKETVLSQKYSKKQSENANVRWSKKEEKSSNNNEDANAVVIPRQCQPEPEPEPIKRDTKVSQKRGSRLPKDWHLPHEWGQWAISEGWTESVIRDQSEQFKDYWHSLPGAKASKLDWSATWRNWMRNSKQPKIINGGQNGNLTDKTDKLRRVVTTAARGTSGQDWG